MMIARYQRGNHIFAAGSTREISHCWTLPPPRRHVLRPDHIIRLSTLALAFATTLVTSQSAPAQRTAPPERHEVRTDDGHTLTLWSRRPAGAARGAVLLLHGRTWSALPNFDLQVRGARVSLMEELAARGYAAYALDQRGYGATPRDRSGWLTPDRAEDDAALVLDWIAAQPGGGGGRPALLGYSRGAMTAMLTAQRNADKLSSLVLYGFPMDLAVRVRPPAEPRRPPRAATTAEGAGEDFISPESTAAGVKDAYVRAAVASDPVRVDWRREGQFNALDPAALRTPTLLLNGDRDPYVAEARLPRSFARWAAVDRWWIVLANADHAAHLERTDAFVQAVVSFIERDPGRR